MERSRAAGFAALTLGLWLTWPGAVTAESYRDRETAAMREVDQCGPAFLTERAPASFGNAVSGAFKPACQRHDACYSMEEQTQKWCDDQFGAELMATCVGQTSGFRALCQVRAKIFENLVRTTVGANSYGDIPAGTIHSVRPSVVDGNELEVCVDVLNDSKVTQEYDLTLYTIGGDRVDREPDGYEVNVESGQLGPNICVSTQNDFRWDLDDLGNTVEVRLRADTPVGFSVLNDMVTVDVRQVAVPGR